MGQGEVDCQRFSLSGAYQADQVFTFYLRIWLKCGLAAWIFSKTLYRALIGQTTFARQPDKKKRWEACRIMLFMTKFEIFSSTHTHTILNLNAFVCKHWMGEAMRILKCVL